MNPAWLILALPVLAGVASGAWWWGRRHLRRELYEAPHDDWKQHCRLQFVDSQGKAYYRYTDEIKIPIPRFERAQLVLREIANRVSDDDIGVFLETTEAILLGSRSHAQKVADVAANVAMFKERVQLLAPPDLYWRLVACWYIREDQEPGEWDTAFEDAKVKQLSEDNEGDVHGFFLRAGLDKFLPNVEGLQQGANELLAESQRQAAKFRERQAQVADAL